MSSSDSLSCSCEELAHPRWRALLLMACITLGNYYIFDLPGTLGMGPHSIQERFEKDHQTYTEMQNGLLYSLYSWPSLVVAVLGGFLIDRVLGLYRGAILFTTLVFLGSIVFSLGVYFRSYWWLVAARITFGLGGEAQLIAQYMFVSRWFADGRGVTLAYGIVASFQRAGIALVFWLSPLLAVLYGVTAGSNAGVLISGMSLAALAGAIAIDKYWMKDTLPPVTDHSTSTLGIMSAIKKDAQRGTLPLFLLGAYNMFIAMGLYGFSAIVLNYFEVKFGDSGPVAGSTVTLFYLVVIIISPIIGTIIDRTGYLVFWLAGAAAIAGVVNYAFRLSLIGSVEFLAILALPQAIVCSAFYPLVPLASPPDTEATAMGLTVSMQNFGFLVATALNGWILDQFIPGKSQNCGPVASHDHGWKVGRPSLPTTPQHRPHSSNEHVKAIAQLPCIEGYYTVADIMSGFYFLAFVVALVIHFIDRKYYRGLLNTSPQHRVQLLLEIEEEFSATKQYASGQNTEQQPKDVEPEEQKKRKAMQKYHEQPVSPIEKAYLTKKFPKNYGATSSSSSPSA